MNKNFGLFFVFAFQLLLLNGTLFGDQTQTLVVQTSTENIFGVAQNIGKRDYMEDFYDVKISGDKAYFGVFDGHSGKEVAQYLSQNMFSIILDELKNEQDTTKALHASFLKADKAVQTMSSGAVAVLAGIQDGNLFVSWAGDSRAVLAKKDGTVVELSVDHKPCRPDEQKRVEACGGAVKIWGVPRVCPGGLAISRAIGDAQVKVQCPGAVIPDPETKIVKITPEDDFLILASDGVWDEFSNQEVVDIIKKSFALSKSQKIAENMHYKTAAQALVDAALKHSKHSDNMTALVVDLKPFMKAG